MITTPPVHAPSSCERGFSLVELLIVTASIVIALGAAVSTTVELGRVRQTDEELNLAYMACLSTLEGVRAVPFAELLALNGTGFDVPSIEGKPGGLVAIPGDVDGLAGRIVVAVDQAGTETTLYRVAAEVLWVGSRGRQHFSLETLIGERDL